MNRPGPRQRHPAPLRPLALLLTCLLATSGCSLFGGGRSAQDEADDLAAALTTGRLTSLRYTGGSPQQAQRLWDATVARLGSARPTVRVRSVSEGSDGAASTARLGYSWDLPGTSRTWRYETRARLSQGSDDTWRVALAPTLVHPGLRSGERLSLSSAFPDRADILGARGRTLVTARPVQRIGIDKTLVPQARQAAAAGALARALDIDEKGYVARVRASGAKAFVEAIVLRAPRARALAANGTIASLPGFRAVLDTLPLAPTREFARPVLGTVGPVDAELVKKSDGLYRAGDEAGLSGLESRYDEELRGTPGVTVQAVDANGSTRDLFKVAPIAGKPLRTTLDPRLQQTAEAALTA